MQPDHQILRPLVAEHFRWAAWEALIERKGVTIDRPGGTAHPDHTSIIYPMDYGYVNGTTASDDEAVDVFCGTAATGLVGTILTTNHRTGDREFKLLLGCAPREIYCAHGFINFDRTLLEGVLVLRQPMHVLWNDASNAA